tara:strand:+ start:2692 stop:2988 length:297 start_codon:yes stop_codon:yes gene_type:complete
LASVGAPLFVKVSTGQLFVKRDPELEHYKHLLVRKEEILLSIKELEFDNKTGKLSEKDYESSRKKLESEALESLERIDLMERKHKNGSCKVSTKLEVV